MVLNQKNIKYMIDMCLRELLQCKNHFMNLHLYYFSRK